MTGGKVLVSHDDDDGDDDADVDDVDDDVDVDDGILGSFTHVVLFWSHCC